MSDGKPGRPRREVHDPDLALRIDINRQRVHDSQQALEERRELIVEALAHGWPQRRIAAACGMSRSSVSQIAASQAARASS